MTIDKTLRIKRGTTSSRSVLTRVERIQKLKDTEKFTDESSPFGLPKVRVRKLTLKKKKKEKKEEGTATAGAGAK
jgi:small basic protein (TIGR04137 family)